MGNVGAGAGGRPAEVSAIPPPAVSIPFASLSSASATGVETLSVGRGSCTSPLERLSPSFGSSSFREECETDSVASCGTVDSLAAIGEASGRMRLVWRNGASSTRPPLHFNPGPTEAGVEMESRGRSEEWDVMFSNGASEGGDRVIVVSGGCVLSPPVHEDEDDEEFKEGEITFRDREAASVVEGSTGMAGGVGMVGVHENGMDSAPTSE